MHRFEKDIKVPAAALERTIQWKYDSMTIYHQCALKKIQGLLMR